MTQKVQRYDIILNGNVRRIYSSGEQCSQCSTTTIDTLGFGI